jgi:hypothetical protein
MTQKTKSRAYNFLIIPGYYIIDFLEMDITRPVLIRRYTSARFMIYIYYNTTKKSEVRLFKYKDKLSAFI